MTVTAETTTDPIQLTDYDYIVSDGDPHPSMPEHFLPWALDVNLHVRADTPILVRVHDGQQRVVIQFGIYAADLHLFATAGQLDRLITLFTAARQRLP